MNKEEILYEKAGLIYTEHPKVIEAMTEFAKQYHKEQLILSGVGSSFIWVKDQKPPKNTELIAQDPKGGNYLTSWRESYSIFMCQSKQEDSCNWKWKQI